MIQRVDPFDEETFEAWHRVYAGSQVADRGPDAAVWQLEELVAGFRKPSPAREQRAYAGFHDGAVVSAGYMSFSRSDNLDSARVAVDVAPAERRRGHGTRMLEHLAAEAKELGREVLHAGVDWRAEAGEEGTGVSGVEFLRHHGFALGLVELQRRLELPVPAERLAALRDEAYAASSSYTLRSWVGPIPDELLQGWAELDAAVQTEAPMGDLDLEAQTPDVEEVRHGEQVMAEQKRVPYHAVALDPEDAVVAFSQLVTSGYEPGRAYQWGTLVRRDHRGHRLGLAVKVANVELLQREAPEVTHVLTWNAGVNEHMIGINERIGFRVSERAGQFQKRF